MKKRYNSTPKHIYRYISIGGYDDDTKKPHDEKLRNRAEKIFTHNELYFSTYTQLNDIFELSPSYIPIKSKTDMRKFWANHYKRNSKQIKNKIKNHIQDRLNDKNNDQFFALLHEYTKSPLETLLTNLGILSFTENPKHPLMWAHYADSNRGICLRFKTNHDFFNELSPVDYSKDRVPINPSLGITPIEIKKIVTTKAKYWKYEEEWRVLNKKEAGVQKFPSHILDGVILGERILNRPGFAGGSIN